MKRIVILLIALSSVLLLSACAPKETTPTPTPTPSPAAEPQPQLSGNVVEINMVAKQFEFIPGTAEPIRVKLGDTVRITATSPDVSHGFAIPAFGVNAAIDPGKETTIEFVADKAGEFGFFCSVFCGRNHGAMKGTLIVEP